MVVPSILLGWLCQSSCSHSNSHCRLIILYECSLELMFGGDMKAPYCLGSMAAWMLSYLPHRARPIVAPLLDLYFMGESTGE